MVHTHASLPRGCFGNWGPDNEMKMKKKGNENEVKMTMRWKLLNQDAERGTQKKRERANTNTWNLAQNGQPWKGKGKEKRRPTENGTRPAEEGEDRSAWTNLTRRQTYNNLSTQRAKPTWREENARTHEKGRNRDPWGTRKWHDASTKTCSVPLIRLYGLHSRQPYRRLSVFRWITCTVEPHRETKKKWPHL